MPNEAVGNSELVSLTGPLGAGAESFVPQSVPLPYTIRFENPPHRQCRRGRGTDY